MKKILLILGIIFLPALASAATPQLLFSDMTDAPVTGWEESATKGAAVSIYARNVGTSRGSSYVTVGGVNLTSDSDYAEWGATTNPTVPLGMQRITFWLNSSMTTGGTYPNTTIKITTTDGTSEAIPFHVRDLNSNHIYILNQQTSPAWIRENLVAGDVAYLRAGTYNTEDDDSAEHPWAHSGIFDFCYGSPKNFHDGIEGKSISVTAYPGELVKFEAIDLNTHPRSFLRFINVPIARWTFSKFQINALQPVDFNENVSPPYDGKQEYIRFINLDITTPWIDNSNMDNYSYGDGIDFNFGNSSHHVYVLGSYIHDVVADYRGQPQADPVDGFRSYFLYANGYGTMDHLEIGWNEFGWNSSSRGLQFYGHRDGDKLNNLYLHDNWIHDTTRQGVIFGGEGGDHNYSFIDKAYIYNNIISNSGTTDDVLQMGGSYGNGKYGGTYYVYNNVLDGSNNNDYPTLHIGYDLDHLYLQNNIIIGVPNTHNYVEYFPSDDPIPSGNVTADHNLYYGAGTNKKPDWDNSTLDDANPLFITSPQTGYLDFQLQSSSPAINSGVSIATVATDFLDNPRPQGSAYDIGAYEYQESGSMVIRADVDNNSQINTTDAMLTLRNSLGLDMSGTNWQSSLTTGDVNCDGNSNSTDAMLILRYSLGLEMSGTGWCGD